MALFTEEFGRDTTSLSAHLLRGHSFPALAPQPKEPIASWIIRRDACFTPSHAFSNSIMIGVSGDCAPAIAKELAVCSFYTPADEINAKLPRSQEFQA